MQSALRGSFVMNDPNASLAVWMILLVLMGCSVKVCAVLRHVQVMEIASLKVRSVKRMDVAKSLGDVKVAGIVGSQRPIVTLTLYNAWMAAK